MAVTALPIGLQSKTITIVAPLCLLMYSALQFQKLDHTRDSSQGVLLASKCAAVIGSMVQKVPDWKYIADSKVPSSHHLQGKQRSGSHFANWYEAMQACSNQAEHM